MKNYRTRLLGAALALLLACGVASPSRAETGEVRVVFTKGGFIVGVGGGTASFISAAIAIHSMFPA